MYKEETFTQQAFTQRLSHREAFTEKVLHRETFTQRKSYKIATHANWTYLLSYFSTSGTCQLDFMISWAFALLLNMPTGLNDLLGYFPTSRTCQLVLMIFWLMLMFTCRSSEFLYETSIDKVSLVLQQNHVSSMITTYYIHTDKVPWVPPLVPVQPSIYHRSACDTCDLSSEHCKFWSTKCGTTMAFKLFYFNLTCIVIISILIVNFKHIQYWHRHPMLSYTIDIDILYHFMTFCETETVTRHQSLSASISLLCSA